jgi:hypothetical protein
MRRYKIVRVKLEHLKNYSGSIVEVLNHGVEEEH